MTYFKCSLTFFIILLPCMAHSFSCTDYPVISEHIAPIEHHEEFLLHNPAFDIVVASIISVENNGPSTNINPPVATLQIHEVLRGKLNMGRIESTWLPLINAIESFSDPCPLNAPIAGTRFIAFVYKVSPSTMQVREGGVFDDNQLNRETILREASPGERDGAIQLFVFFAVIALSFSGLFFILLKNRKIAAYCSIAAFILYFYYETGISEYSDIRVDLLFIIPALIMAFINLIICLPVSRIKKTY